jgi:hypothetical protein
MALARTGAANPQKLHAPHDRLATLRTIASTPSQATCTPMQSRTNAITRKIPCTVLGAIFCVIFGA